jgi:putative acetyltransferase
MIIRPEAYGDRSAVSMLITTAFRDAKHSGGNEAEIVAALQADNALALSLVASKGETLTGYVAFSLVAINGEHRGWFGLGPVAVLPAFQRRSIGKTLISTGLSRLRKHRARGCVVLGDPAYYARFGFRTDPALRLTGVPPAYFQRLAFGPELPSGTVEYHPAFAAP